MRPRTQDVTPAQVFGAVSLRSLDWDTQHFGRKMGVLAIDMSGRAAAEIQADLRSALAAGSRDGYAHLMLRVPAERLDLATAAERCGMRLVDVAVDLVARHVEQRAPTAVRARAVTERELGALRNIASTAFEFSRFATDPFFSPEEVSTFYRQWITNLYGGMARAVLVMSAADEIAGFTTCAVQTDQTGRIPLIATSDDHRRQGIGYALIESSLAWFANAGIGTVWVRTQVANYAALALYNRAGFNIGAAELTFTVILRPEEARA
ncbi:MAG TPA: GNAT family N-acetyltransferase [Candidatus Acidoferrales bacterium]|nr:GNAT family N-acetyltransferase [Candidatus Acidoferrales bacterium]